MNDKRSLSVLFRRGFPVLSAAAYVLAFACVFNTFDLPYSAALYNILLALPVFGLLLMLTRRFPLAVVLGSAASFLLLYADQLIFSARLTHLRLSDLLLIGQAARVANRYHLIWNMELTRRLLIAAALCGFLFLIARYYKLKYRWKLPFFSGLALVIVGGVLVLSGILPHSAESFDFTLDAEERGLLYSWYCQLKNSDLAPPEGYSPEAARDILARYTETDGAGDVNVIVIMNESLADYSLIGEPRFRDPLPFIHGLVERGEAFEGRLAVSVFGGGTANTEYEFLTGNSLAFLPEGCTPYLQYVKGPEDNLTSELGDARYDTAAIHPYFSEEWNRSQVYRSFGFDRFISGTDFGIPIDTHGLRATIRPSDKLLFSGEGPLYVRGLISDQTDYERLLSELGDRSFLFNVTMQNHGGYDYAGEDFVPEEYVTEADRRESNERKNLNGMLYDISSGSAAEEVSKVNQYLTLSALSDQAFAYLIRELEKCGERTVVLLFGDHQPGVLISEHYVDAEDGVDPDYTVPYLLWANFDMEFDAPAYTSPNYLSAILKKNAGLPLTPWDQFRLEMLEKYPVMTANGILDPEGNPVPREELSDYELVQYMRMFG